MKFRDDIDLVLHDIFVYDISECHYQIMKRLGMDVSSIDRENKLKRNTQIGLLMKKHPNLTNVLRKTTNSVIDEYLRANDLTDDDLIIRQYDGIMVQKILKNTNNFIPLDLRNHFDNMILSFDRMKYIANDNSSIKIKGVSNNYRAIAEYFHKILKINFSNKSSIFKGLDKIKKEFMASKNVRLFTIPEKNSDKYIIILKGYGQIIVSESIIDLIEIDDIDKQFYFDKYLTPFTKSIVLNYL